jgi:hypothetical protein
MQYMLANNDAEHQERWYKQVHTGYNSLSENEKESDRHVARHWLDAIGKADLANRVQELSELVEYKGRLIETLEARGAELQAALEAARKGEKP